MNGQFHMICLSSKNQKDKDCWLICIFAYRLTIDSYSEQVNQYSTDVGHSDQLLETKIQNEQLNLMKHYLKKFKS